jgi:hypothetical protein
MGKLKTDKGRVIDDAFQGHRHGLAGQCLGFPIEKCQRGLRRLVARAARASGVPACEASRRRVATRFFTVITVGHAPFPHFYAVSSYDFSSRMN